MDSRTMQMGLFLTTQRFYVNLMLTFFFRIDVYKISALHIFDGLTMLQYNTIFLYIHIGRDKNIYYTFNHKKLTFVNKLNLNKN